MAHLLLAGYFGSGNLGDDAILLGFVEGLKGTSHNLTVMSGNPEETYRLYGFPSIQRKDFNAIKDAIEKCDAMVFPGGSIFQDSSSVRSVAYYSQLVKLAKAKKKKVIMLGQGVGPLKSFFGKRMAASAFNEADVIAVRDPSSMTLLKDLGVKRPIKVTADLAFLLPQNNKDEAGEFSVGSMKTVGISVRPHGKDKDIITLFADLSRLLFNANYMPVLIEMDKQHDFALMQEISKAQGGKIPDLKKVATPMQLQQRFSRMEGMIAMRLHAGILAAGVGIPPFMVSYDPKVSAFAKLLDIQSAPPVEGLTAQRLFESFMAFQKDRERNEKIVQRKRDEMIKSAQMNIQILNESLGVPATL